MAEGRQRPASSEVRFVMHDTIDQSDDSVQLDPHVPVEPAQFVWPDTDELETPSEFYVDE